MPEIPFHFSEIFFALPLIWGGLRGYNRGIVLQFVSLMGLLLLFYLFTFVIYAFSKTFFQWFGLDIINTELFFTVIFMIIALFGVHIFVRYLFDNFTNQTLVGVYSRLSGLILGILRFGFIMSIFYTIYNEISPEKNPDSWFYESRNASYIYKYNKMVAPFIFNYLRFEESRDVEFVKSDTLSFGGQVIPIEPTIDYLCDSTKSVVWKYVYLNVEETLDRDTSIIEAKISYDNSANLNNYTYHFLLMRKDSTVLLYKYFENDLPTALNKAYLNLSDAHISRTEAFSND